MNPTRHKYSIFKQVMDMIPPYLVSKVARARGVDKQCRSFSAWSHTTSMIFAQVAHSLSLNDVCDSLGYHSGALSSIRDATPPSRNGLSHANRVRDAKMAEDLFLKMHDHLHRICPGFGIGVGGLPRRFKRTINMVDSTTIQLVANCMNWGRHRRQKAAAKCHVRLDLQISTHVLCWASPPKNTLPTSSPATLITPLTASTN